jgi:hypothetical protein
MESSLNAEEDLKRENELEMKVEEEQEKPLQRPELTRFVPKDNELYEPMEFFLLGSPKRQLLQGGDSETLRKAADEAMAKGSKTFARINYESAAKIALYKQDRVSFEQSLEMAEVVTSDDQFGRYHRILLQRIDEAMRIAKEYYAAFEEEEKKPAVFARYP